jgi:AmmeMemoRadiSam system protein B/AmmeMemoRadiSam system protein A
MEGADMDPEWIRPAAVAGAWYPDDPQELSTMIDGYLQAVKPVDGAPEALIVPHAGYRYSGSVAAYGFKQLEHREIDTAVLLASDHQPPLSRPISVWSRGGFDTPLGVMPVNERLAGQLVEYHPDIRFDPETHLSEHPIEIELPFLKRVCPDCQILPVQIGSTAKATVELLAQALIELLPRERVVIIASSDLSHYPAYDDALRIDRATLGAIELADPEALRRSIKESLGGQNRNLATCACGEAPIQVAMKFAAARGAETSSVLHYANSGDVEGGDHSRVVGYGAVMFWHYEPPELSKLERAKLLALARQAVEKHTLTGSLTTDQVEEPALQRRSAVFVTLRRDGQLRGCIGQVAADEPLYQAVRAKAVAAASEDPRFPALRPSELDGLSYEIAILSPTQRIASKDEIEIGRHGVAIRHGVHRSVLLPQVAGDRDWGREQLLEHLCTKAGLPTDAWKRDAALYRFTTIEVGDEDG